MKEVNKMRNLTIKRRKTFVGCLAEIVIYIADSFSNDFLINDTPCREIGRLKNGEEKTFPITEEETKIFIIADTGNKNYCKTFYQLTSGNEDMYLSGKCVLEIANGFHLDDTPLPTGLVICHHNVSKKHPLHLVVALIAVISPFAMWIVTMFWSVLLGLGLGVSILGYSSIPDWMTFICLLPLSFSPLFDVYGIVLGIVKSKERYSKLCVILSTLGLLINAALLIFAGFVGSRY